MEKVLLVPVILLCLVATLCGCGKTAEEAHVQELEIGDTWTVDGQWELTPYRALHVGTGSTCVEVLFQYTNIGCETGTEGHEGLYICPKIYATADLENEYPVDEISIRAAAVGKSVGKCGYFVVSSDDSDITECYIVFSQTADDGETYEAVYHWQF